MIDVAHREFHLQEISARILNKIRDVASNYLRIPVKRAVVTVPAYFNDRQRQAVKDAGKLIDLEVVRIINEPTAAALAYGVGKNLRRDGRHLRPRGRHLRRLSIIEIRDRVFEVKATGGDIFLGGIDFDNAMIHYVLDGLRGQDRHRPLRGPGGDAADQGPRRADQDATSPPARRRPFNIPFITMTAQGQPLNIEMNFTRKLLEELTTAAHRPDASDCGPGAGGRRRLHQGRSTR